MLHESTTQTMASFPTEREIIEKVVQTLADAGNPIEVVEDGSHLVPVQNMDDIFNVGFSHVIVYMETASEEHVTILLGEGWDALANYSVSLTGILADVLSMIEGNQE